MNTTLRTLLAAAMTTAAFVASSPAYALGGLNGVASNGVGTNRVGTVGFGSNGVGENSVRANARLPQIESIVLKDGRELPAR